MSTTEFSTKAEILADLWMTYRGDSDYEDFIEYNDLGLPLAYAIHNDMVVPNESATRMINETYALLWEGLGYEEDPEYRSLEDLINDSLTTQEVKISDVPTEDVTDSGYALGAQEEQSRIQFICKTMTEMYLATGKGQKAVFWREAGEILEPVVPMTDEEYKEDLRNSGF